LKFVRTGHEKGTAHTSNFELQEEATVPEKGCNIPSEIRDEMRARNEDLM
jgi:hypothetical protein